MSCVPTAAELLVTAEMQGAGGKPYTWLMYRPPWSSDTCSKACIFQTLLNRAVTPSVGSDAGPKEIRRDRLQRGRLLYCAAKTMTLTVRRRESRGKRWVGCCRSSASDSPFFQEAPNVEQTRDWFMQSLELGCGDAAMELINLSNRVCLWSEKAFVVSSRYSTLPPSPVPQLGYSHARTAASTSCEQQQR